VSTRPLKPEQPVGVLIMVHVPPTFRGLSKAEVRRKLSHPMNMETTLDSIADSIVRFFNKPVDYKEVMTLLASQLPTTGGDNN
jgi:hypothetical protein